MNRRGLLVPLAIAIVSVFAVPAFAKQPRPLVLAHYMPWHVAKPHSRVWGWHWTMNHFDPENQSAGRRNIASHFYPTIGPYDSGGPAVLEYHLLTMKLAGIDGVIVDWYGLTDFRDYAVLHRSTAALVSQVERLGMKFVVCYEDQTIPALVEAKRIKASDRVSHAIGELKWLAVHWFKSKSYVRLDGDPVLLSFGQTGLNDKQWSQCLAGVGTNVAYFSQHNRRTAAVGAFDWPVPTEGLSAARRFVAKSTQWRHALQVAFPRFIDVYEKAKVHRSYGRIEDANGATFRQSVKSALAAKSAIVQIATWNDWGEGTQIEPSVEYGYRDVEFLQRTLVCSQKQKTDPRDLRLPRQLLDARRHSRDNAVECDRIALTIARGDLTAAKKLLNQLGDSAGQ